MVPSVVLALALVTSGLALPFSTQDTTITGTSTGIHTEGGTPITQTITHGEKTGIIQTPEGQTHTTFTKSETTNPITQTNEKTGLQGTPEGYTQQQTGLNTGVTTGEKTGTYEKQTGYQNVQPVVGYTGQTGVQTETYVQQKYPEGQSVNNVVPKTQGEQTNYEQPQTPYTERPLLLPVQPLSVVPVGQALTPVVVPTEAIAAGRIIIMTVEPVRQQSVPQDIISTAEKVVPYSPVAQTPEYIPVQNPVQVQEPFQQVYNAQPVQTCPPCSEQNFPCPPCSQTVQKQQVPYTQQQTQSTFTPVQTPTGENYQQTNTRSEPVGTTFEQTVGTPVQTQTIGGQQVIPTGVEKQGSGFTPVQGQTTQQGFNTEGSVEKHAYQTSSESTQVQNPVVEPYTPQQQSYNVQQQVGSQTVGEKQVPYTQTTQEQGYKTGAVEQQQQQYNPQTQPQTNVNYVANQSVQRVPVFGEKLQPEQQQQQVETQTPVQTYSVVPPSQQQSVVPEPSVVVPQVSSQ